MTSATLGARALLELASWLVGRFVLGSCQTSKPADEHAFEIARAFLAGRPSLAGFALGLRAR